jgi:NADH-quinone oxidoreductase subunit N
MAVFMFALLGFPLFGGIGFIGKLAIIQAVVSEPVANGWTLAVVLVVTSAISAGYYLYVVRVMFMGAKPEGERHNVSVPMATRLVIGASAALILALGLFPASVIEWTRGGSLAPPPYMTQPAPGGSPGDAAAQSNR